MWLNVKCLLFFILRKLVELALTVWSNDSPRSLFGKGGEGGEGEGGMVGDRVNARCSSPSVRFSADGVRLSRREPYRREVETCALRGMHTRLLSLL